MNDEKHDDADSVRPVMNLYFSFSVAISDVNHCPYLSLPSLHTKRKRQWH